MTMSPSFLIVGAMKCATSTIQKQLSLQPGIFMTTPKEPNFFSDDETYALGIEWYQGLFAKAAKDDICGEASTHYTKLPTYPNTIERLITHYGKNLKIIYIIRSPIDRLISHYMHEWSVRKITTDIKKAVNIHPELISYSLYHYQISPYLEAFGKSNVLLLCHERLASNPKEQLAIAASFVGYKQNTQWIENESKKNVSSERIRKFPGYDFIIGNQILENLRRNLVPVSLRQAIKKKLTIKNRPELDSEEIEKLTHVFDEDLYKLGNLMGFPLSCATYAEFSQRANHEWQ